MATGTGKTMVMGMVAAWSILDKVAPMVIVSLDFSRQCP